MNEEINEVISYFEEEKIRLKELMDECLSDSDFEGAHQFQRGIIIVNHQLDILKKLSDANYSKKKELENSIDFYNKILTREPKISEYYTNKINQVSETLKSLNNISNEAFYDGQEFDDAIFDLIEQRIKGFIFRLKKSANLYLDFSIKNNYLRIKLTPFLALKDSSHISKHEKKKLNVIGFSKNRSKKYLRFKYSLNQFKDAIEIKTIESRVIYEVFFYHELDTMTTLEIKG